MVEGAEQLAGVTEGEILAGKFRVERVLGVGGMGAVVAARHLQLEERVALKFLLPAALANQESVARFAREARAAVKIKSDHVAACSTWGRWRTAPPVRSRCLHPGQQQGLRRPSAFASSFASHLRPQQMNSLRANGVISITEGMVRRNTARSHRECIICGHGRQHEASNVGTA